MPFRTTNPAINPNPNHRTQAFNSCHIHPAYYYRSQPQVEAYSLKQARDASGRLGQQMSIPLSIGPVRQGTDKQGTYCAHKDGTWCTEYGTLYSE